MEPIEVLLVSFFTVLFFLTAPKLILLGVSCIHHSNPSPTSPSPSPTSHPSPPSHTSHTPSSRLIDLMVFEYVQPPPELLEKMKRGEPYTGKRVLGTRDQYGQLITQIDVMELYGSTSTNTACCICLGDYENGECCARSAKCEHIWHKECIEHWIGKGHVICPLCRTSLVVSVENVVLNGFFGMERGEERRIEDREEREERERREEREILIEEEREEEEVCIDIGGGESLEDEEKREGGRALSLASRGTAIGQSRESSFRFPLEDEIVSETLLL